MKQITTTVVLSALMLIGCTKESITPNPTHANTEITGISKNIPANWLQVGAKINGIILCTVDEDVLKSAVINYYGAVSTDKMLMKQYNSNSAGDFFAWTGKVKNGNVVTHYAFELIPNYLPNGDIELYLPVAGTEQRVQGIGGNACKLVLTSGSTGYVQSPGNGNACQSVYSSSTSTVDTDLFGTNKLILEILSL